MNESRRILVSKYRDEIAGCLAIVQYGIETLQLLKPACVRVRSKQYRYHPAAGEQLTDDRSANETGGATDDYTISHRSTTAGQDVEQ